MKTEIAPESMNAIDIIAIETELRPKSSEALRLRFYDCYHGAAKLIAEAAVCVKILQERGDNLKGIPMVGTFRRIASGQILPELVWSFIESRNRQLVERLPLDDQRRIARDPVIDVVEPKPDGGFTKRRHDLRTAPAEIARIAIGPDGLRPDEEQMVYLGAEKARAVTVKVKADREDEPDIREPLDKRRDFKLTASELEALKIHAALAHCSESEIVRRGMLMSGYLKKPRT